LDAYESDYDDRAEAQTDNLSQRHGQASTEGAGSFLFLLSQIGCKVPIALKSFNAEIIRRFAAAAFGIPGRFAKYDYGRRSFCAVSSSAACV
jgi:hypothetical protein